MKKWIGFLILVFFFGCISFSNAYEYDPAEDIDTPTGSFVAYCNCRFPIDVGVKQDSDYAVNVTEFCDYLAHHDITYAFLKEAIEEAMAVWNGLYREHINPNGLMFSIEADLHKEAPEWNLQLFTEYDYNGNPITMLGGWGSASMKAGKQVGFTFSIFGGEFNSEFTVRHWFQWALLHDFGHGVGLNHSKIVGNIMYSGGDNTLCLEPGEDDIRQFKKSYIKPEYKQLRESRFYWKVN